MKKNKPKRYPEEGNMRRNVIRMTVAVTVALGLAVVPGLYESGQVIAEQGASSVAIGQVAPDDAGQLALAAAPALSPAELETLQIRKLEMRDQMAALADNGLTGAAGLPLVAGRATNTSTADEGQFPGNPALFVIGRNNRNTNANNPAKGSTLAEPAAANNSLRVFAAGNFNHAEVSTNGGVTWADVPLPAGPAAAPTLCCDHDVVIDDASRVTFHSALYINAALTTGAVRIFVRRVPPLADCSYTVEGPIPNRLPDYPHIGLTKRFLYLSTNNVGAAGGFARMTRFNLDQMENCVATAFTTFSQSFAIFGQRVWVPGEGANNIETMRWGQRDNATTFRIFSWSEAAGVPVQTTRLISASNAGDPDCRGGVGNFDFIRSIDTSLAGFGLRTTSAPGANGGPGVFAAYWNVSPDAAHTQGHIHAAVFNLSGLGLLAQPHVFNNTFCFGFPIVTANKRGDIGITLASGGRAGGGGTAARGFVGLDDEFTTGLGSFGTVFLTASGTHNRSDGRYGDYFTIHPYEACEKWFSATNYARLNGTALANINSRYIEFGRNQSFRCYRAHANHLPTL
jgi:hypothetical protein